MSLDHMSLDFENQDSSKHKSSHAVAMVIPTLAQIYIGTVCFRWTAGINRQRHPFTHKLA